LGTSARPRSGALTITPTMATAATVSSRCRRS
jgi:hypothetical protein